MSSIYKYFSKQEYAESFMNEGQVFFQSLSHFTACEEVQLRDEQEGSLLYKPSGGLQLNLTSGGQVAHHGEFISRAKNAHRIFVFCTSLTCSSQLAQRFKAKFCVEIFDLDEFSRRLQNKMRDPIQRFKNPLILRSNVQYVSKTTEPGIDHALTEKIIFRKQQTFAVEAEYRFAFGLDTNVFDAYNVEYSIGQFNLHAAKLTQPRVIKIGPLSDICTILHNIHSK